MLSLSRKGFQFWMYPQPSICLNHFIFVFQFKKIRSVTIAMGDHPEFTELMKRLEIPILDALKDLRYVSFNILIRMRNFVRNTGFDPQKGPCVKKIIFLH